MLDDAEGDEQDLAETFDETHREGEDPNLIDLEDELDPDLDSRAYDATRADGDADEDEDEDFDDLDDEELEDEDLDDDEEDEHQHEGYFEDDDYCRRVQEAGYQLTVCDDVFVHHHHSASFNQLGDKTKTALMKRNRRIFEKRWGRWVPHAYRAEPGFGEG